MATTVDINFAELIDLSLGTPEIVNYKGLRVLLSAIVTKLGVSSVNLELNEGDKKDLNAAREAKAKGEADGRLAHLPDRPATGANHKDVTVTDGMEKSKSSSDAAGLSSDKSALQNIEDKVSRIEGQLNSLNSLPSNQSLMARSGTSVDGNKTTPVSDMWQLMQVQKKAAANEEGVSKLMSMVGDIMRELRGVAGQLDEHSTNISDLKRKFAALDNKHGDLQKEIEKVNEYNKTVESRLNKLEMSTGQQDKIDELHQLLDALRNQLASLPDVDSIVTWPAFEDALKGAYKEPIDYNDSSMQTAPIVDNTRMQTMPTTHASAQTTTPTPPPSRPVSSKSVRSAVSSVSTQQPTQELQRILKELGELTGRHNILEDRVNGLEELLAKKADMSEIEALLSQTNVPEDLANKLAELEEGLNHLRDSREKLEELEQKMMEQRETCPATLADLEALRRDLEQALADLAEAQDALAKDVSQIGAVEPMVGEVPGVAVTEVKEERREEGIDARLLAELEHRLQTSLQALSGNVQVELGHVGDRISSLDKSLRDKLQELRAMISSNLAKVKSVPRVGKVVEEQVVLAPSVDQDALEKLKSTIAQLQADIDKLNSSYVHLVDEHNVKQKHIDALYTFVDRLQENKADKEHVIMEIDVKADKRALDSKVSRSHFDGAVDELSKNLNDVMDKMTGHKVAWDSAVSELKLDIDNKLDRMELDPLKSYLDNRIKAVSAKMVRSKEVETGEDAAGFRRPLQKFHCISCDRPLDMTPQTPIASLPENKGLPANRSGRPYTTFELEQIRAAQKNTRPGRNVQHYQRALYLQELARQRRQDILAYLVHFDKKGGAAQPARGPLEPIGNKGVALMPPLRNFQYQHTYGYKIGDSSHFQDVPDYFVASRSCGGSHTLTYPHRRITRVSQLTNVVTTAEDITPVVNGRVEADIQGQDGHIYRARLDTGHMTERLPTLTQPRMSARAKSPRLGSARGRRTQPPTRQNTDVMDNAPVIPTGATVPRPTSARVAQRPTSARPGSAKPPSSPSSGGRGSPMAAPANTVDAGEAGAVTGGGSPPPPTPREPPMPPANDVTVPQPPQDPVQS
ncbi:uncharacterized protein [Diadema setosum]|uniref:uncharacterized protein n=1 Tax=Diadema setosum TaxID=31175 RepID=UPI003B3BCA81